MSSQLCKKCKGIWINFSRDPNREYCPNCVAEENMNQTDAGEKEENMNQKDVKYASIRCKI